MGNKNRDLNNLTNHHLSIMETSILASNLNRIEEEKERQKNPNWLELLFGLICGILAIPIGGYMAIVLLQMAETAFAGLFIFLCAIGAFWVDIQYIGICWSMLTGK